MEIADAKRLKELSNENGELKKVLADEVLKTRVLEKSFKKVASTSAKKRLVYSVVELGLCSARRAFHYLSLSSSSWQHRERGSDGKKKLIKRIIALSRKYPRYENRRIRALLIREG